MKRLVLFAGVLLLVLSCQRGNQIIAPNRVLDRPLDAVLTCMKVTTDGSIEALSVGACDRPAPAVCTEVDVPQLIAFIANSERNEVAMARRCDTTAAVVDMDGDTPGYQLIPVGQLPSHIAATELGCRVVTSNTGSCDMSILDATGLSGYALDVPPASAPSSLVSRLVPLRSDGIPLGARPGKVISAPDELSLAGAFSDEGDPETVDDGGETGTPGTGGDESGGADDGLIGEDATPDEFSLCPPGKAESVWVTFPTCQLVAEVSLNTGQILQSRQFAAENDGSVTVLDGGTAPDCPVDCPIQFPDGAPPVCDGDEMGTCRAPVDPDGYFPTALELVLPPTQPRDAADLEVEYPALFVGGLGSDSIVEIQFEGDPGEEDGQWEPAEESLSLTLERAQGVHAIRATPPMTMASGSADNHQFLYVIAGDGATHVVDRSFSRGALGNECDTQIDPTVTPPPYPSCNAIDPTALGQTPSPDRRPFAIGPGIRASLGAAITDWAFYKLGEEEVGMTASTQEEEDASRSVPFGSPGVVGVGVTSFGRVVLSVFSQLQNEQPFNATFDPVGIMNLSVPPHSLWPSLNPYGADPTALPLVDDNEPDRALPGAEDTTQTLSPSLRRIDLAYADAPDDELLSEGRQALADALGNPSNADTLGTFDGEGVYANEVARAVVRDYQQYQPLEWALAWEGTIPGTRSATGRLECDAPGWENGTCVGDEDNPSTSRLIDESAAFCDAGVLPGDKIVLLGCASDDDCGLGQRCLQEPTAPGSASGICVSAQAYEDDFQVLRQVCAPFINDPCGDPRREFLVTDAFQNELWLRAVDIDKTAHLVLRDPDDENSDDDLEVAEVEDRFTCALPYSTVSGLTGGACLGDADCVTAGGPTCILPPLDENGQQPPGLCGCERDKECRGTEVPQRCYLNETRDDLDQDGELEGNCRSLVLCGSDQDCQAAEGDDHVCDGGVCRGPCTGGDPECFECADATDCGHYGADAICSDAKCMRGCESGDPDCTRTLLPGPRCFPELVTYVVRLRHSFLVEGNPTAGFIPARVVEDSETGRCREDPSVSTLLTSRIRLGEDQAQTFGGAGGYPYVIPECPNADEAAPTDPNPCRITQPREANELTRFHTFSYEGESVAAIRFSNPFLSLVIDLTDLRTLGSEIEQVPEQRYGPEFRRFRRGRLPRGYRESFIALPGYIPFSEPVVVRNIVMVYPVRIIKGPETTSAFIVDAGGRGGPMGVRGQLIRIIASAIDTGGIEDLGFLVR